LTVARAVNALGEAGYAAKASEVSAGAAARAVPGGFVLRRREEGCRAGRVLRLRAACVAASNVDNEEVITHEEAAV
jgi:hypothetical protein